MAGHGLGNTAPGVYDSGAKSQYGEEHRIVADIVDAVDTHFFLAEDGNGGPRYKITVQQAPLCNAWCVAKHHPHSSHLHYLVEWFNDVTKPFDLIVSVHMNSADDECATGVEVLYSKLAPPARKAQAEKAATILSGVLGLENRGVKSSNESQHSSLALLDGDLTTKPHVILKAPALLFEVGFVSNCDDVKAVKELGVQAIVAAIKALTGSD